MSYGVKVCEMLFASLCSVGVTSVEDGLGETKQHVTPQSISHVLTVNVAVRKVSLGDPLHS